MFVSERTSLRATTARQPSQTPLALRLQPDKHHIRQPQQRWHTPATEAQDGSSYLSSDGRRKATFEEAFSLKDGAVTGTQLPWAVGWQKSERNLVWNDELKTALIKKVAAEQLGMSGEVLEQRLQELHALLPGLEDKFTKMEPKTLVRLAADTQRLGGLLIQLKALFPTADVGQMVLLRPSLVLCQSREELRVAADKLRDLLPGVDIDRLIESYPNMLDTIAVEQMLAEAKRLLPNMNITQTMNTTPETLFKFQRREHQIPYDQ